MVTKMFYEDYEVIKTKININISAKLNGTGNLDLCRFGGSILIPRLRKALKRSWLETGYWLFFKILWKNLEKNG